MSSQYIRFPFNGVPTYPTLADFPALAMDGALGVALDTDTIYVFDLGTLTWIPSGGGGGTITGSGAANQLTYWTSASNVSGNANFSLDTTAGLLKLGSGSDILDITTLTQDVIAAGAFTDSLIFSFPAVNKYCIIEYSVTRGSNLRLGTLLVTNDGVSVVNVVDNYSEIGSTDLDFSSPEVAHTISAGNVEIRATSIGGVAGTLKKSMRRWN